MVGAGAAGITLALELAGAPFRVCLMESGGMEHDAETQRLYEGTVAGHEYFPLSACRLRYFGGTTNHWAGVCRRLDPIDFEARDWVPLSGWPFGPGELEPHYRRAREICELGPRPPAAPESSGAEIPFSSGRLETHRLSFSPPTRFGEAYQDELEKVANLSVYLRANAVEIEPRPEGDGLRRIRFATLEGNRFSVRARSYVLAAGGIENPRLLLASRSVHAAGVGNAHDLVGRCFMEHPHLSEASTWLLSDGSIHSRLYEWPDPEGGYNGETMGVLAVAPETLHRERMLGFSAELRVTSPHQEGAGFQSLRALVRAARKGRLPDELGDHLWNVLADLDGAAWGAYERATDSVGDDARYELIVRSEQAPNPESRVTLAEDRDALGMPRARLDWRLTELDLASLRRGLELIAREVGREGYGRVRLPGPEASADADWVERIQGGWHHMGTTRMADDPRRGVVDADGRVHGLADLYVAGSSVFPTAGWSNPTLTLVALAVRLAAHLERRLS